MILATLILLAKTLRLIAFRLEADGGRQLRMSLSLKESVLIRVTAVTLGAVN